MTLFSIQEIIDIIIMTLAVGFIFKDMFRAPAPQVYDPLRAIQSRKYDDFTFAIVVTAPAIILHEFGHKFVALAFGLHAVFHAAYTWLAIGVLLKLFMPGFIFFVPAYVAIQGFAGHIPHALIAFAGPGVNLLLYLACKIALKLQKVPSKYVKAVVLTQRINGVLFLFNMLPIPGFDGFQVYSQLFQAL
ncbi:hypothetical protein D6774_02265 [Candidatus Woesearchaeota archaeon]|nr:MAG: hypothetical protein D6774_02265 [Candidatus Woesearchaeota archaeon]